MNTGFCATDQGVDNEIRNISALAGRGRRATLDP
jgi:hypothetical protein